MARPKLRDRISIIDTENVDYRSLFYPPDVGQIRMKHRPHDIYDPETWIATIELTRVIFRWDLMALQPGPIRSIYGNNIIKAEDPKFFKKLEKLILRFLNTA